MLSLLQPDCYSALTIHAEVEGIACLEMFDNFLTSVISQGGEFVSLGALLDADADYAPSPVIRRAIPGREGWVACRAAN